jgi:hypothetical protein
MLSEASYHNMTVGRIPSVEGGIQPTILDAKGDLIVATGNDSPNRLAVGANNLVLTADSAQATGVKWADPLPSQTGQSGNYLTTNGTAASWGAISAGGMTLISTTSLTGTSVTLSSIPQTYVHLNIIVVSHRTNFNGENLAVRFNADSNANRHYNNTAYGNTSNNTPANTFVTVSPAILTGVTNSLTNVFIPFYTDTATRKFLTSQSIGVDSATATNSGMRISTGFYNQNGATTSLVVLAQDGGTFQAGTVYLYGVK